MFANSRVVSISLVAALALLGCRAAPSHESHDNGQDHAHDHADADHAAAKLTLDDGKKWTTDATLRSGMTGVRNQLQAAMASIHDGAYSREAYKGLAAGIDKEINTIVGSCKLPPNADAQLHLVIAQLLAGTEAMKNGDDPMAGAMKVMQGLESYSKFFEHPNWSPLKH